ncbi:MAG: transporter [Alphaproteobacteria bacterium]|nr:transporter [Alphaproteobacteria bacterium]
MTSLRLKAAGAAVAVMLAGGGGTAHAAGFAVYEQSTTGLGTAFAGAAAVAEDASTIFFNPAGMVHLPDNNAVFSVSPIFPNSEFTNNGSTTFTGPGTSVPTAGPNNANGGTPVVAGASYFSHQLSEDVWFGVGLNAPFGLVTAYDADWVGRYNSIRSQLFVFNLNTAMAFKISNSFSIGVGLNLQYANANLTNMIDGGLLIPPGLGGPLPGAFDTFIDITADSLGFGANVGGLWEPIDGTRIGVHYRSSVDHDFSGDADLMVAPGGPPLPAWTTASANLTLPDTVSISVLQNVTPELDLVADATWTNWSVVPQIVIELGDGLGDAASVFNWEDTWRFSGGAIYRYGENWTFRLGYAYDESPVPNATFRSARVPDNDRHWATIGATYGLDEHFDLSIAYAHLFLPDTPIASIDTSGAHLLVGNYDSSVDIFSLQVTTSFESLSQILD